MKLHELPERRVAVTIRLVDAALLRMLHLLSQEHSSHLGRSMQSSVSEDERTDFLQRVRQLRRDLRTFAEQWELPEQKIDARQVLNAEISTIWTLLENCYPKRMKGFGEVFKDSDRPLLEKSVRHLLEQVESLIGLLR
jgi:hypothetical protein